MRDKKGGNKILRLTVSSLLVSGIECLDIETSFCDDEVVRHHDSHDAEEKNLIACYLRIENAQGRISW